MLDQITILRCNNIKYLLDTIEKQNISRGHYIYTKVFFDDHINQIVNKATKMT